MGSPSKASLHEYSITGTTYAPEGLVIDASGVNVQRPAALPSLLQVALCCSLCNDSAVQYNAERGTYEKVKLLRRKGHGLSTSFGRLLGKAGASSFLVFTKLAWSKTALLVFEEKPGLEIL